MIIKIFGGKGEGKTTLSQLLEETLRAYGFHVENHDEDAKDAIEDKRDYRENLTIMKEAAQKGDILKVEIKTIPYGRETLPQYAKKGTNGP